jgi:hypothetical protein
MFRVIISIGILLVVAACIPNRHATLEKNIGLQVQRIDSDFASGKIKESDKYRQYMRQMSRHPEGPSHWKYAHYQGAYQNSKLYEDGRRSQSLYEQIKSNSIAHWHNMVALEAQQNAAESRRRQAAFDQAIDNLLTVKQPTVSPPDPDRQLNCTPYNYGPHNQGFHCR